MASPTVPTVPIPTPTDNDTDDDDDDDISSLIPSPVATTPPVQPPPADTLVPAPVPPPAVTSAAEQPAGTVPGAPSPSLSPYGTPSSLVLSGSQTRLAENLSSSLSSPTSSAESSGNGGGGLSTGASAGIGVGVAIAVILMAIGAWLYARTRRRRRQHKRKASQSTYNGDSPDEEVAQRSAGAEVRAYYAGGVSELPNSKDVSADDPRRFSELASPVVPQEVHGDREFAAELPGSAVSAKGPAKSGEGWSSPPPVYEQAASQSEKKSGVRLFDDAPIDEHDSPIDAEERPSVVDEKGGL